MLLGNIAGEYTVATTSVIRLGNFHANGPYGVNSSLAPNAPTTSSTLIRMSDFYSSGYLAPVFNTIATQTFSTGSSANTLNVAEYLANASRVGQATYSISASPAGVTINASGLITIPAGTESSTSIITVTATGPTGLSGDISFSLVLSATFSGVNYYDFRKTTSYTAGSTSVIDINNPTTPKFTLNVVAWILSGSIWNFYSTGQTIPLTTNPISANMVVNNSRYGARGSVPGPSILLIPHFSLEALVRLINIDFNNIIMGWWLGDLNFRIIMEISNVGKLTIVEVMQNETGSTGSYNIVSASDAAVVSLGTWQHFVVTSANTMYVNGTEVLAQEISGTSPGGTTTSLINFSSWSAQQINNIAGQSWNAALGYGRFGIGSGGRLESMDNIVMTRFHSSVLTPSQVSTNYADLKTNGNPYSLVDYNPKLLNGTLFELKANSLNFITTVSTWGGTFSNKRKNGTSLANIDPSWSSTGGYNNGKYVLFNHSRFLMKIAASVLPIATNGGFSFCMLYNVNITDEWVKLFTCFQGVAPGPYIPAFMIMREGGTNNMVFQLRNSSDLDVSYVNAAGLWSSGWKICVFRFISATKATRVWSSSWNGSSWSGISVNVNSIGTVASSDMPIEAKSMSICSVPPDLGWAPDYAEAYFGGIAMFARAVSDSEVTSIFTHYQNGNATA